MVITKDTSESCLKQRKEIIQGKIVYIDQPAVRAAKFGRVLILDGIEKAERNVLPTLNNLLENREMSLDDGGFLMRSNKIPIDKIKSSSHLIPVHPEFRVVAFGSPVPPYRGRLFRFFVFIYLIKTLIH
jgi:hypothetical protein